MPWTPDRPAAAPARPRDPTPIELVTSVPQRARSAVDDLTVRVVVRRGDTLWSVAARSLGPGATDAEVLAEWPRWYAANRDVIGPDPGLLLPGQQLQAPRSQR